MRSSWLCLSLPLFGLVSFFINYFVLWCVHGKMILDCFFEVKNFSDFGLDFFRGFWICGANTYLRAWLAILFLLCVILTVSLLGQLDCFVQRHSSYYSPAVLLTSWSLSSSYWHVNLFHFLHLPASRRHFFHSPAGHAAKTPYLSCRPRITASWVPQSFPCSLFALC